MGLRRECGGPEGAEEKGPGAPGPLCMGLQSPDSLKPSWSSTKLKKNSKPLELKKVCKVDWSLSFTGVVSHQYPPSLESPHLSTRHPQNHTLSRVWDMSGDEEEGARSNDT